MGALPRAGPAGDARRGRLVSQLPRLFPARGGATRFFFFYYIGRSRRSIMCCRNRYCLGDHVRHALPQRRLLGKLRKVGVGRHIRRRNRRQPIAACLLRSARHTRIFASGRCPRSAGDYQGSSSPSIRVVLTSVIDVGTFAKYALVRHLNVVVTKLSYDRNACAILSLIQATFRRRAMRGADPCQQLQSCSCCPPQLSPQRQQFCVAQQQHPAPVQIPAARLASSSSSSCCTMLRFLASAGWLW